MGSLSLLHLSLLSLWLLLISSATVVIRAEVSDVSELDETWQQRAKEAQQAAFDAYQPNPDDVTDHINVEVQKAVEMNGTRRNLGRYTGACMATNPIDQCWRCDPNWALNRKRLASCVLGFGRGTVGGKNGRIYVVTDASDRELVNPRPGTLRHAVTRPEPLWIVFARDMIIRLSEELIVASYKTIDGRGANVHIAYGAQITIQFVQQVIIHGIHIHHTVPGSGGMIRDSINHFGRRAVSDGDGISIFGSSHIWIDHVSMYKCSDGLIDVVQGSTAITISNSHFTRHDHVMLFGATDWYSQDSIMQITVAFNHFGKGLIQRMPRCRYGFFHVLNNDYTHWEMYAIGGSHNPTIISQGNRYIASPRMNSQRNASEITKRENTDPSVWKNWVWRSEGDLMLKGAFFVPSGTPRPNLGFSTEQMIKAKPGTYVDSLTRFAGTLACRKNFAC